jgi:hypothetical protein
LNIFVLNTDPAIAAQQQCDKHVVKMVLESAQLLCSPFEPGTAPYRRTHFNHPCSIWTRASRQNYEWLVAHAFALSEEYTRRYRKQHKSDRVIEWCADHYLALNLPDEGLTPFAQAMPEVYRRDDAVEAYRAYYRGDKSRFAAWKNMDPPEWWIVGSAA